MRFFDRAALTAALLTTVVGSSPAAAQADPELPLPAIPADFGYEVHRVSARGVQLAYVDEGEVQPVVFIHGNPTSKYLWRNVIPHVADGARAIALDLPGMGESEKPRPSLGFTAQAEVFAAFVETLDLRDVTLVVHDWGASIGFDYARLHPGRVRGIAFMEGVLPPVFPQLSFEAMGEDMGAMFRAFKDPVRGPRLVIEDHIFVEQILPGFVNRPLGEDEMRHHRSPFGDPADREMLLTWPRALPIAGEPADVTARIEAISDFMTSTDLPLLLLYVDPGVLVQAPVVEWYVANLGTWRPCSWARASILSRRISRAPSASRSGSGCAGKDGGADDE